ncbi:MAG TPA: DegT/DnrJ/EryC1/StrS family aminotransferase [Terriglobia bacterium]|nr:DegT/DnrJ/EryC1/StrS family aminotransferase [Terriglobia bacterium]
MELALLGGEPVRTLPYPAWPIYGPEEEKSLLEVLHSGSWGGYNGKVEEFEAAFAELHQVRHAISCANGTVALEVALRALGIGCGDEVIVPPFTFVATATSVLLCHGIPIFADIDPTTFNLSPSAVEAAITPRSKAIIAVHFGGLPADVDALKAIAERHRLFLIEDAAHAHGARWRGAPVGNFGSAATFSFQAFKLVTSGEGGIMVTNDSDLAARLWGYCNQGRRKGGGWFEHFTLGSNYRLSGFQAAILCAQLRKLPAQSRLREENVRYFRQQLSSLRGLTLPEDDPRVDRQPYYLVTLRYDKSEFGGISRDLFLRAMQAEGIPVQKTYPYPLYRNPVFAKNSRPPCSCGEEKGGQDYSALFLPETERICREGIWLEHSVFLGTRKDVDDIVASCEKVKRRASSLTALDQHE